MKRGMTIWSADRVDLNFDADFEVSGAIGTILTKWDFILLGQCIVFIHNIVCFKYASYAFNYTFVLH